MHQIITLFNLFSDTSFKSEQPGIHLCNLLKAYENVYGCQAQLYITVLYCL